MHCWIDGVLVDQSEARVSVYDHGLTTGDGVFETIKVISGRAFALRRHLERLTASAAALELPIPPVDYIRSGVDELLAATPSMPAARLRITVTGGVSPLGSQRGENGPTVVLTVAPQYPMDETAAVTVVPWPRNERGALAGVKSTSYAENVLALSYAKKHGADEAIFANIAGNLCEGTGSNVFFVRDGRLVTPPLPAGCLAGVTRALVLEWMGAAEEDAPVEALAQADEAFLASTARDVQPIRAVDGSELPTAPGPVTRKAMEVFAQRNAAQTDP